jgi:hypothetical protein
LKDSSHGLIGYYPEAAWEGLRKTIHISVRTTSVLVKIQTEDILHISLEHYLQTNISSAYLFYCIFPLTVVTTVAAMTEIGWF